MVHWCVRLLLNHGASASGPKHGSVSQCWQYCDIAVLVGSSSFLTLIFVRDVWGWVLDARRGLDLRLLLFDNIAFDHPYSRALSLSGRLGYVSSFKVGFLLGWMGYSIVHENVWHTYTHLLVGIHHHFLVFTSILIFLNYKLVFPLPLFVGLSSSKQI